MPQVQLLNIVRRENWRRIGEATGINSVKTMNKVLPAIDGSIAKLDLVYDKIILKIWLILPELMCSFQRLSHACISINDFIVKPRTAHYNSYDLLDLDSSYKDNCGNSRANTCTKALTSREECIY